VNTPRAQDGSVGQETRQDSGHSTHAIKNCLYWSY
jgi:hypothetical protein